VVHTTAEVWPLVLSAVMFSGSILWLWTLYPLYPGRCICVMWHNLPLLLWRISDWLCRFDLLRVTSSGGKGSGNGEEFTVKIRLQTVILRGLSWKSYCWGTLMYFRLEFSHWCGQKLDVDVLQITCELTTRCLFKNY